MWPVRNGRFGDRQNINESYAIGKNGRDKNV